MSTTKGQEGMEIDQSFNVELCGYSLMEKVGEGAYGEVFAAKCNKTGRPVAIKRMVKCINRPSACRRTFRELRFLRLLQHENVVGLVDVIVPAWLELPQEDTESKTDDDDASVNVPKAHNDFSNSSDIYAVFDLMESDLTTIIKSPQPLTQQHCKFFTYQVLRGLKYIHSAGIIHRDLKPRNLLVNSNCDLRICDLGLARLDNEANSMNGECMTDYIATRWYRPPEVVVAAGKYTKAIDMWAVGCIMAELMLRKPLFPASDQRDLLNRVVKICGPFPDSLIRSSRNPKMHTFLRELNAENPTPKFPLSRIFKNGPPDALDLLSKLLVADPSKRLTVEEALSHPYFQGLHLPSDEPSHTPVCEQEFYFEKLKDLVPVHEMQRLIHNECSSYPSMASSSARHLEKNVKNQIVLKNPPVNIKQQMLQQHQQQQQFQKAQEDFAKLSFGSNNSSATASSVSSTQSTAKKVFAMVKNALPLSSSSSSRNIVPTTTTQFPPMNAMNNSFASSRSEL